MTEPNPVALPLGSLAQRWRSGRASYRPAGEPIQTSAYEVAAIKQDGPAKAFVQEHHYSGTYPAARFRFALYHGGTLHGVAVFSVPVNERSFSEFACPPAECTELGRFVLLDQVAANGETWFLGRCFELLRREGIAGILSFADPVQRTSASGEVIFPGHLGIIYRAHNARYRGRSRADTKLLLPNGRIISNRALAKIRARERGWRYAAEQLVSAGAEPLGKCGNARGWLKHWLPLLTRPFRHRGNLRYLWALREDVRKRLPASLHYPRWEDLV